MFTVETGETLPRGGFAFTAGADKFSRDPGNITVLSYGWAFAAGITNHISAFVNFDAYNHVHVGRPRFAEPLRQHIGNPQFGNTIYRTIVRCLAPRLPTWKIIRLRRRVAAESAKWTRLQNQSALGKAREPHQLFDQK